MIRSSMSTSELEVIEVMRAQALEIGKAIARKIFDKRGNHSATPHTNPPRCDACRVR